MPLAMEMIARAIFLFFVLSVFIVAALFSFFVADSGPNSTSTYMLISAGFFGLSGIVVGCTPSQFLFSGSAVSKIIFGTFALSIVQVPIVMAAFFL